MATTKTSKEEKREKRLERWLNPQGVKFRSPAAAQKYKERATRTMKALMLEIPDRVPVQLPVGNFPLYRAGGNLKKGMYDYDFLRQSWTKFMEEFYDDMDSFHGPALTHSGTVLEILQYKLYRWPGHGLGEDVSSYQFVEGEYMRADVYDELIRDPGDFIIRTLIPRVVGSLAALQKLPRFRSILGMPMRLAAPFANPEVREAFQSLIDAGRELEVWQRVQAGFAADALAAGFPATRGGMAVAPFDTVGDSLRGTQGVIMDMYRQPEKLLEAIDVITDLTIEDAKTMVGNSGGFIVSFPLHKGDDTFMSDKQFDKFYWPSLKKVIDALVEDGIMVSLFAEGKYNRRLDYIHDFPKGWVHWLFDQTDMAEAKRIVGKNCSISGNVPTSLMCTGTAKDVKEYCRKLIETCAPGGGYILAGGASATECKPENFKAMMQAAKEYGVYR